MSPRPRERGSATLETVIVFPCLLLLIWGAVQAGLWYHARNVCLAAAQEGARAGAAIDGTAWTARAAALTFPSLAGDGFVSGWSVEAARTAGTVTVTVTADGLALVPGFPVTVTQAAALPVERVT